MNTNMQEWGEIICVTTERKKADTFVFIVGSLSQIGKSCRAMESQKKSHAEI